MEIFDDYIDQNSFKYLFDTISSDTFPWFYNNSKLSKDVDHVYNYQFIHRFYYDAVITSAYYKILLPIVEKMEAKALVRIKANLNPPSNTLVEYNKHTDQKFKCKAAIYYVNSNDGYTIIGDQKIESKANRIVFFDADVPHSGTNSTDCKNRMVINFNYF